MINLVFDTWESNKHAQKYMADAGITYSLCVPQSIADCWWFFDCKNVPKILPEALSVMKDIPLSERIGLGLSKEDVAMLENSK
jgi:hypothetical protein